MFVCNFKGLSGDADSDVVEACAGGVRAAWQGPVLEPGGRGEQAEAASGAAAIGGRGRACRFAGSASGVALAPWCH